jgi:hypothetical protein
MTRRDRSDDPAIHSAQRATENLLSTPSLREEILRALKSPSPEAEAAAAETASIMRWNARALLLAIPSAGMFGLSNLFGAALFTGICICTLVALLKFMRTDPAQPT